MYLGQVLRSPPVSAPVSIFKGWAEGLEAQPFWLKRIFEDFSASRAEIAPPGIWRKLVNTLCAPLTRNGFFFQRRLSAIDVMHRAPDQLTIGVSTGSETILIAHRHVILVSGENGPCDADLDPAIEGKIAQSLMSSLKGYYDEAAGLRVLCLTTSDLAADDLRLFIGRGVFAPLGAEKPLGWLRFYPDPKSSDGFFEPTFGNEVPAALYRGQKGLSFCAPGGSLPASLDLGLDEPEPDLMVTLEPAPAIKATDSSFSTLAVTGSPRRVHPHFEVMETPAAEGVDQSWQVIFPGADRARGRMDLCLDSRPSRMHTARPQGRHASIVGLRIDPTRLAGTVSRFWFHVNRDGLLTSSPFRAKLESLIWDFEQDQPSLYSWADFSFKSPRRGGFVFQILGDGNGTIEVSRTNEAPFGHIALPPAACTVLFSDELQSGEVFSLDWLDHAGAVEIDGEAVPLATAFAQGDTRPFLQPEDWSAKRDKRVVGPLVLR